MARSGRYNVKREGLRAKVASHARDSATFDEYVRTHNARTEVTRDGSHRERER